MQGQGYNGKRRASRRAAAGTVAFMMVVALIMPTTFVVGPRQQGCRGTARVVRRAGDRAAYIAIVQVNVTNGMEPDFLYATLENARYSCKERSNLRFDVLESQEERGRFALVEMYRDEGGPIAHKETEHYLTWRQQVADWMASPREATQWDVVFPEDPSTLEPDVIMLERDPPVYLDVNHIMAEIIPGQEEEFIEVTKRYIKAARDGGQGAGFIRMDLLRSVEEPSKFLIIEVFRSKDQATKNRRGDNHARWNGQVGKMMAETRSFSRWVNQFPSIPAGWQQ